LKLRSGSQEMSRMDRKNMKKAGVIISEVVAEIKSHKKYFETRNTDRLERRIKSEVKFLTSLECAKGLEIERILRHSLGVA